MTCDYVVAVLRQMDVRYLRVNSEDLPEIAVSLDPTAGEVIVKMAGSQFRLTADSLVSILYRRPVFLRDYGGSDRTPLEDFQRYQWATFLRNLMILDKPCWMNHPAATYTAEHKALQLAIAHRMGFEIPHTVVTNSLELLGMNQKWPKSVAIKGLDTVLLREGDKEVFGYTNIVPLAEIRQEQVQMTPVVFQEALTGKTDLRITVVGPDVFSASVTQDGAPIEGDWRQRKTSATFRPFDTPHAIARMCRDLVRHLGLNYGAIDLALVDGHYFFLEINPTGEWAWLVDRANLPIDRSVANRLVDTSWIQSEHCSRRGCC